MMVDYFDLFVYSLTDGFIRDMMEGTEMTQVVFWGEDKSDGVLHQDR